MNPSFAKPFCRAILGIIPLLALMIFPLASCSSAGTGPTSTGATVAAAAPSMTTTAVEPGTETAATATTKAERALNGPQAQSSQLSVKTGETKVATGKITGNKLVFIWVEVENLTDMEFTVSSLLSVSMTDKATGSPATPPNVPDTLIRLAAIDPDALTLDGKLAARGRIAGWIYAEFPVGASQVAVQMVLTGTDGAKTEPVALDITI